MSPGRLITWGICVGLIVSGVWVGLGADSLNGARLIAAPILILVGFGLYARMVYVAAKNTKNSRDLAYLRRGYSVGRPGINEKEQ